MEVFKYKKPISFMSMSKRFGILSVVLLILSLGIILTKGFNYGIDFAGGTLVQVQYEGKAPISEIRDAISKDKNTNPSTSRWWCFSSWSSSSRAMPASSRRRARPAARADRHHGKGGGSLRRPLCS